MPAPHAPAKAPATISNPPAAFVKVRALRLGYFGERRRRKGDVFKIPASLWAKKPSWMELAPDDTPESSLSPSMAARRREVERRETPGRLRHDFTPIKDDEDDEDDAGATGDKDVLA